MHDYSNIFIIMVQYHNKENKICTTYRMYSNFSGFILTHSCVMCAFSSTQFYTAVKELFHHHKSTHAILHSCTHSTLICSPHLYLVLSRMLCKLNYSVLTFDTLIIVGLNFLFNNLKICVISKSYYDICFTSSNCLVLFVCLAYLIIFCSKSDMLYG